ncbi:MAG: NUDIX hydrolase [Gammaproteobacteria bacterium]|nr:NUDIX hydrolase [Gammaproteobacteria bacterium]MDE2348447.1 NUDIX hydrolase [Gammaproteobacteria bacterium]
MHKPTTVDSRENHRGRVILATTVTLRAANGRLFDHDLVRHPGAAAVVPVDAAGRVCLVRQYRLGVEDFLWEIPAGKLDAGEAPAACAVRELREETGVTAGTWSDLGRYFPAPAIFTEVIHLFLARDLEIGPPAPDADEELELRWLALDEAIDLVLRGEISDGKTALGLVRARHRLGL